MLRVNKNILILFAGVLWSAIGILLVNIASRWFPLLSQIELILVIVVSIILGSLISFFGFSNIAKKNINRINLYEKKVHLLAFQKWQSYLLILFMISLGVFMRTTSYVPKIILSSIYISIGFALFTASFTYYFYLSEKRKNNDKEQ